jgi:DNA-binding CsgD family transcriptional regulator
LRGRQGIIVAISDLTPPPTDRRSRAESGPRLFERGPLLAEFEAIFSRTLQVPSRCIAIEGTWGSGRTALINAACETARRSDCLVLRARGGDVEKQIPFAVLGKFVESAVALAAGSEAVSEQANALQGLLGSGVEIHHDPADISPLFHSLLLALRELGPVLLAVDDADLADRETLAVLEYVVRRLDDQQIWVLLSARPLHPGIGLRPVDGLLTESETRQFILEPLQEESVRTMLAGFFGEEPDHAFVVACRRATGGSPLFLKTLLPCLARWHVRPTADMADRVERVPAPKITQLVLGRLAQLPVAASDLLQACAVLGAVAEPAVARLVAKIDALAAERAADAAGHMELLQLSRPFAFSSPLIRWAVYFDIPTARRSQLHARAAQLLAEHGATEVAVAEHLLATEPVGDIEMVQRLQQISRAALAADDPHLALRCLNRALAESPPASRGGSLYLDLASVELALGRPSALSHFLRAVQMGVTDDSEVIRVAIGLLLNAASAPQLRAEAARAMQGLTGRLVGVERDLSIEFELALAMAMTSGRATDRQRGLERIRALAAPTGSDGDESAMPQMARTFIHTQEAASTSPMAADQLATALEAVADADLFNGPDPLVAEIQMLVFQGLLVCDRFSKADELVTTALKDASERGLGASEQRASVLLGTSLLWQGSLTAAEEAYRHGRALGSGHGAELTHHATLGLVDALLRQGRTDEAEELLDQLRPEGHYSPSFESAVRIERGRLSVARGHLHQGLDQFIAAGSDAVRAGIVNAAMNTWRTDAAMVLSTLCEWAEAGRLAHEHLSMARQFGAARSIGLGLRAAAAATPDLAERSTHLSEAVELLEPSPARLEASYALVELGMVLVDRGKKEEARGVLRRGANLASLCGAHQLVESAGVQLRAAGARPRRLGSIGPDSLTPSERRVARLAAAGKTNQGIAADLYVTVKTVEGHLAKTYRKLGVDSRRSLALALGDDDEDDGELLDASSL